MPNLKVDQKIFVIYYKWMYIFLSFYIYIHYWCKWWTRNIVPCDWPINHSQQIDMRNICTVKIITVKNNLLFVQSCIVIWNDQETTINQILKKKIKL